MMSPNLRCFDRTVRFILAVVAFAAAAFLFEDILARSLAVIVGGWCLYETVFAVCPALAKAGVLDTKKPVPTPVRYVFALQAIQAILAYEWWGAGFEKIMSGTFPSELAATLAKFASENPYGWVNAFLLGPATENSVLLGYVIQWSEIAVAVLLVASIVFSLYSRSRHLVVTGHVLSAVALSVGMILNASFFFAAGWLSPSTHGVNLVMFWTQAALLYVACAMLVDRQKA